MIYWYLVLRIRMLSVFFYGVGDFSLSAHFCTKTSLLYGNKPQYLRCNTTGCSTRRENDLHSIPVSKMKNTPVRWDLWTKLRKAAFCFFHFCIDCTRFEHPPSLWPYMMMRATPPPVSGSRKWIPAVGASFFFRSWTPENA